MAISEELRKLVDPNNECCCEHCISNRCKEWSVKHGYTLESGLTWCNYYANEDFTNDRPYLDYIVADTEPEAIFKACECILKESK